MDYRSGVTVIIPTYNREKLLGETLKSLCFQTLDKNNFEVIVVDDGSTDNTEQLVYSYSTQLPISYYYQEDKGFRVAQARNVGIENAKFNVCLFLDSGILASRQLLKKHWMAHQNNNALALIGYAYGFDEFAPTLQNEAIVFNSAEDIDGIFSRFSNKEKLQDQRKLSMQSMGLDFKMLTTPWILFWTCHASCSTKSLIEIGGFDEHFQSWGGEDVELALRLFKRGIQFDLADECEVFHSPHERSVVNNKKSSNENCQYIYRKHPSRATYLLSLGNHGWESIVKSLEFQVCDNSYV
jgi:glycosyltransferase involved in cell wall biosynthesis